MFGCLLGCYTTYTFSGSLAKFTLCPSLAFSCVGSVTVQHSSNGVSQTLRHGTRNVIMELLQRASPIFGWAVITLGIGPHSSCKILCTACISILVLSLRFLYVYRTCCMIRSNHSIRMTFVSVKGNTTIIKHIQSLGCQNL